MLTTLAGYVGARYAATYWIRPHFETPKHLSVSLAKAAGISFSRLTSGALTMTATPPNLPNAWSLSASVVDQDGKAPTSQYVQRACPTLLHGPGNPVAVAGGRHTRAVPGGAIQTCIAHIAARFHEVVTYQPASRYWPFQVYETALFVFVAFALAAVSMLWVRRHLI